MIASRLLSESMDSIRSGDVKMALVLSQKMNRVLNRLKVLGTFTLHLRPLPEPLYSNSCLGL